MATKARAAGHSRYPKFRTLACLPTGRWATPNKMSSRYRQQASHAANLTTWPSFQPWIILRQGRLWSVNHGDHGEWLPPDGRTPHLPPVAAQQAPPPPATSRHAAPSNLVFTALLDLQPAFSWEGHDDLQDPDGDNSIAKRMVEALQVVATPFAGATGRLRQFPHSLIVVKIKKTIWASCHWESICGASFN